MENPILKKERSSNLELFRIIVMFLIVAHHYVVNSGLIQEMSKVPFETNSLFLYIFGMWGKTGINCFILITGYFMCQSNITLYKFTKLVLQVIFYKIIFTLIFALSGYHNYSIGEWITNLSPLWNIKDGFVSCFLVFYLFIPFLNILIKNMDQRKHRLLLILCLGVYTIWGNINIFTNVTFNYITWFSILYLIASYIRLYPIYKKDDYKFWGIATILSIIIAICIVPLLLKINFFPYKHVSDSNAIFAVIIGICSFMFFKNIPIKYNKAINMIGASTFGILLIHANSDVMRQWLWRDTLNNVGWFSSDYIYIHAVLGCIGVFVICSFIDILRIKFIEKPILNFVDRRLLQKFKIKF